MSVSRSIYVSRWVLKRLVGSFYVPEPPQGVAYKVSIVTPVYKEVLQSFAIALDSWIENRPHEIIAVIDQEDEECARLFNERAQKTTGVHLRLVITDVPGKRPALVLGVRAAEGEIVALVDSDTVWESGALPKLVAPFFDQEVGGVTCRQCEYAPDTLSRKITSHIFNNRYCDEMPFLAKVDQGFSCLSGRTAAYRRGAILPVLDELVGETFFGRQCISGDDKQLTYLIQSRGYKTRFQDNVTVYTISPPKLMTLLKQKVRWTRNSWRADLRRLQTRRNPPRPR